MAFLPRAGMLALATAALRCCPVLAFVDLNYDPNDNLRPGNITGLDYSHYQYTGSYYNGTWSIDLKLKDRHASEYDQFSGDICGDFINETLHVELNGMVAVVKKSPKDPGANPVMLDLFFFEKGFNLSSSISPQNYSVYQNFDSYSQAIGTSDRAPVWELRLIDRPTRGYDVAGNHSADLALWQDLRFNLTDECPAPAFPPQSDDAFLFRGHLIQPENDTALDPDWADGLVPVPSIESTFDDRVAYVDIVGYFDVHSSNTELVGELAASFVGDVDPVRSDQLLLGLDEPKWNATVGFEGQPIVKNGAVRSPVAGLRGCLAAAAVCVLAGLFLF
ncbi:hypothetical protein VTK73DRAFT_2045 [Phialemonium thermophilum]|uniref:Uncharacterized protein n=1 Tax=Phialemonium thermophilum TaxID=223376 RepID=A0ABR3VSP9_9PEZI